MACGKGVCEACCIDTSVGLSCSDACSGVVRLQRSIVVRGGREMGGRPYVLAAMGGVLAIPSTLFVLLNLLAGDIGAAIGWLPLSLMGVLFIGWARHNWARPRALAPGVPPVAGRLRGD